MPAGVGGGGGGPCEEPELPPPQLQTENASAIRQIIRQERKRFLDGANRIAIPSLAASTSFFPMCLIAAEELLVVVTVTLTGAPFIPKAIFAGVTTQTLPVGAPEQEKDAVPV